MAVSENLGNESMDGFSYEGHETVPPRKSKNNQGQIFGRSAGAAGSTSLVTGP